MTSEQLEAARSERMRLNGLGTLTLEDARTWIEETGLCLFLPKKQALSSVAPSFVEAISGRRNPTPDSRQIAAAEDLLVRLELDGVAVRLNLLGQPGEQPDFVVASWVLPYVYALRGDRDWRRNPQLTGSRAVSPLAVQAYKLLEANDSTISQLKHALGREVSESAVVRAITELWQQLRIIPVIAAPGHPAKWQLLRQRFQKAIAEGASTSQVTAISVLASIYLQAVIAASMEEVELFLAALTARSKVREVLRGLVATRQVHTISMGHAPHFYVAGTLPEFAPPGSMYGGSALTASSYYFGEREEPRYSPPVSYTPAHTAPAPVERARIPEPPAAPVPPPPHQPIQASKAPAQRPHFSRSAHTRNRKPVTSSRPGKSAGAARIARRTAESRTTSGTRSGQSTRWSKNAHRPSNGKSNGAPVAKNHTNGFHANGNGNGTRNGKAAAPAWSQRNGHGKIANTTAKAGIKRGATLARKEARPDARSVHKHKPALTAGAKAGNSKRFGFTARAGKGTKKRG